MLGCHNFACVLLCSLVDKQQAGNLESLYDRGKLQWKLKAKAKDLNSLKYEMKVEVIIPFYFIFFFFPNDILQVVLQKM